MGVQILFELIDDDYTTNPDELIDRFAINVSMPVGTESSRTTYNGIFGFAIVDASLKLVCAENFYGPNCDMPCLDNCTCEPGFTGEFCATSIDDCVGAECIDITMEATQRVDRTIINVTIVIIIVLIFGFIMVPIVVGIVYYRKIRKRKSDTLELVEYSRIDRNHYHNASNIIGNVRAQ